MYARRAGKGPLRGFSGPDLPTTVSAQSPTAPWNQVTDTVVLCQPGEGPQVRREVLVGDPDSRASGKSEEFRTGQREGPSVT